VTIVYQGYLHRTVKDAAMDSSGVLFHLGFSNIKPEWRRGWKVPIHKPFDDGFIDARSCKPSLPPLSAVNSVRLTIFPVPPTGLQIASGCALSFTFRAAYWVKA